MIEKIECDKCHKKVTKVTNCFGTKLCSECYIRKIEAENSILVAEKEELSKEVARVKKEAGMLCGLERRQVCKKIRDGIKQHNCLINGFIAEEYISKLLDQIERGEA